MDSDASASRGPDLDRNPAIGFRPLSALSPLIKRRHFRDQRFHKYIMPILYGILDRQGHCTILDVGGDINYWKNFEIPSNVEIHILNIEDKPSVQDGVFKAICGDARDMSSVRDGAYDFVHSNSLIEHVGTWSDMRRAADEIRRVSTTYYVQTPNFWFPVDPHSNMPLVHWLPHPVQRTIFSAKARGFYPKADTVEDAMAIIDGTRMIDSAQMTALFPDASIEFETFAGLKKSLIAVKS